MCSTGTRAEYGQLQRLIGFIQQDVKCDLQLIATGMYLSPEFGLTCKQKNYDSVIIDRKIEILINLDSQQALPSQLASVCLDLQMHMMNSCQTS